MKHLSQLWLLGPLLCAAAMGQTPAKLDRVLAAEKTYFREIPEFPMDVTVTTVVTDPKGRSQPVSQGSVGFLFRGYNPNTDTSTLVTDSSVFKVKLRGQSMTGHSVVIHSGAVLRNKPGDDVHTEIQPLPEPGNPVQVTREAANCEAFDLWPGSLMPKSFCGVNKFWLAPDENGDLVFQHYRLESQGMPVDLKMPYVGMVHVTAFSADEEFQRIVLPGDPKPFLLPLQVVSTFVTNKGRVEITNVYAPRQKR